MAENIDEKLALLIEKFDGSSFQYNHHCGTCGAFAYSDCFSCKKCKSKDFIKKAIPFSTSGSAIEKLICWMKEKSKINTACKSALKSISRANVEWINSDSSPDVYRQRVILTCVTAIC